jgi:hypothetical protein
MSLLPEIESELLRVARMPLTEGAPVEAGAAVPRRARRSAGAGRGITAGALAMIGAAASIALAAVALLVVHGSNTGGASPASGSGFPGAPRSQPGSWHLGGMACPLAPHNRYLPERAGCVSVARGDVDGDGRADLILLYGTLSKHRIDGGFLPIKFTLEVIRASGGLLTARVPQPLEPPTLLMIGNDNRVPGEEVWVHETHISSGELTGVYTFDGHRLRRAGAFWYGGDSAARFGFTCSVRRATIVQRQYLLVGPTIYGRWHRTVTTYAWVGGQLHRAGGETATTHGFPRHPPEGVGCGKFVP